MLEYLMAIWNILRPFGIYFMAIMVTDLVVIWYIFVRFGILYQEKSGNPVMRSLDWPR
jgi:hypothetical protein